jgi:uncharacterized protein YbaR (Trm112 family)
LLPDKLIELLACPYCKGGVRVEETRILCTRKECGLVFSIRDGIPVFLIEEAEKPCPQCGKPRTFEDDALHCPACGSAYRYSPTGE